MFKWFKLIAFIRNARKKKEIANFKILTTESEIIICEVDKDWNYGKNKLKINY